MNNKAFKYVKYLSYLLLLLGVGVFAYFVIASVMFPEPSTEFPVGTVGSAMGVDVMLIYAYIIFAIALVLAIVFPLINIISNPKGAMRTLVGLVVMIVIFGISYLCSSDTPVPNPAANGYFDNPVTLRLTDVGLYAGYAMFALTLLVILRGEIRSAFKRG